MAGGYALWDHAHPLAGTGVVSTPAGDFDAAHITLQPGQKLSFGSTSSTTGMLAPSSDVATTNGQRRLVDVGFGAGTTSGHGTFVPTSTELALDEFRGCNASIDPGTKVEIQVSINGVSAVDWTCTRIGGVGTGGLSVMTPDPDWSPYKVKLGAPNQLAVTVTVLQGTAKDIPDGNWAIYQKT
jgi:hypothetical protein